MQERQTEHTTRFGFLATLTMAPNMEDWTKLLKLMNYLKLTQDLVTCLSADDMQPIKRYVDASFAVHNDYRSHTGVYLRWVVALLLLSLQRKK